MKWMRKFQVRLKGLTDAVTRFPLTTLFLVCAAILNAYLIIYKNENMKWLMTFIIGAFLSAVSQVVFERFFSKASSRLTLMGLVTLLTAGYYLIIMNAPDSGMDVEIRTAVALFSLLIAFIWVPVIKSNISFNKSFMITFKAFFLSLFFSAVLFGGISIILGAIDQLIFRIDPEFYGQMANVVFILFAPMFFLSLIPAINHAEEEDINQSAHCPKFLEVLLSYIVIPLIAVFTMILIVYMIKNIGGKFWTDNLLEPMLVTYAITVILVYILVSELANKFAAYFRTLFPKILIPIVLFQITSSVISLSDTGITHTRYYVILFGLFAAITGFIFSLLPVRKNGVVALLLIIFAAISIVPPVDAFTISRTSQTSTLKEVLLKNKMLEDHKIKPNSHISDKDKLRITNAVQYLYMMGYTKNIDWLPKDFNAYNDFYETFGFKEYQKPADYVQSIYLSMKQPTPIDITGHDIFVQTDLNSAENPSNAIICHIKKSGKTYTLVKDQHALKLTGADDSELISFKTTQIFDKFDQYQTSNGELTPDEATFTTENSRAKLTIVVQNINIEKQYKQYNDAFLFVFVEIK
ncbi:DUF4153 domain-containing protein [Bacillus sp. JJ1764]|uniref:DUF4153 domain-containing protein n=1 Tax=Bacillus sp. JJ1764 TaxID=3122964 RepID=UPI002FFE4AC1